MKSNTKYYVYAKKKVDTETGLLTTCKVLIDDLHDVFIHE
jgi:hypothetical protein